MQRKTRSKRGKRSYYTRNIRYKNKRRNRQMHIIGGVYKRKKELISDEELTQSSKKITHSRDNRASVVGSPLPIFSSLFDSAEFNTFLRKTFDDIKDMISVTEAKELLDEESFEQLKEQLPVYQRINEQFSFEKILEIMKNEKLQYLALIAFTKYMKLKEQYRSNTRENFETCTDTDEYQEFVIELCQHYDD
jgi:hypothetical protein